MGPRNPHSSPPPPPLSPSPPPLYRLKNISANQPSLAQISLILDKPTDPNSPDNVQAWEE